jgi:hypothetical protein
MVLLLTLSLWDIPLFALGPSQPYPRHSRTFLYSAKAPASAATPATAHCCPIGIAKAAPAFEADLVCAEGDSVGLTVEEMVGRSVVDSPPVPVSPCRLTISTYALES